MNATKTDPQAFSQEGRQYLLIGSGRVARHLSHYFNLLEISYKSWDRSQDPQALQPLIASSTHILLAISDGAIEPFYRRYLDGLNKTVIHFSGAHHYTDIMCAHPLMTFGPELYDFDFYKKIFFAVTGAAHLRDLLPFANPWSVLDATSKPLYHALCVVGGNFSTLLINQMLLGFSDLQIPAHAAQLYLQKNLENAFAHSHQALTGPLARKDRATVAANLQALNGKPALEIYKTFLKIYWPEY